MSSTSAAVSLRRIACVVSPSPGSRSPVTPFPCASPTKECPPWASRLPPSASGCTGQPPSGRALHIPSLCPLATPQRGLPPPSTDIRHDAAYYKDYPGNHQDDQPCRHAAAARLLCWWRRGRGRRRGGSRFGRRCGGWRRRKRGSGRRRRRHGRRRRRRGSRLRCWRRCRRGCLRRRRRRCGRGRGCRGWRGCRRGRRCRGRRGCWRRCWRGCRGWRRAYAYAGSAAHRCLHSVHILDDPGENVGTLGGGGGHRIRKGFLPQQREGDGLAIGRNLRFRQVGACVGEPGG